jgi:ribosome-binding protein aMBF1 (putative translation factor)
LRNGSKIKYIFGHILTSQKQIINKLENSKKVSNYLGEKIKELREKKNLLLRQIAAHIEADTALISKIEKGDRKANKEQVIKIAEILETDASELLTLWLADKVETAISGENSLATDAMNIVKKKIKN